MNTLARGPMFSHRFLKVMLAALVSAFVFALPVTASAEKSKPGIYHKWIMRGQVLSLDGNKGLICIGKRDNAKEGQILDAIRQTPTYSGSRPTGFRPENVGQVKITKIVDDHYSEFEVVKGEPKINDTVELERK